MSSYAYSFAWPTAVGADRPFCRVSQPRALARTYCVSILRMSLFPLAHRVIFSVRRMTDICPSSRASGVRKSRGTARTTALLGAAHLTSKSSFSARPGSRSSGRSEQYWILRPGSGNIRTLVTRTNSDWGETASGAHVQGVETRSRATELRLERRTCDVCRHVARPCNSTLSIQRATFHNVQASPSPYYQIPQVGL